MGGCFFKTEKMKTAEATGSTAVSSSFVKVSSLTVFEGDDKNIIIRDVKITATQGSPAGVTLQLSLDADGDDIVYASGATAGTAGQATATTKSFNYSIDKWCELGADGIVYVWIKGGTTTWTKTSLTAEL